MQISVIEEQKQEAAVKSEEENKPRDVETSAQPVQANQSDGKRDMNDASMEEAQVGIWYFLYFTYTASHWASRIYLCDDIHMNGMSCFSQIYFLLLNSNLHFFL